MEYVVSLIGIIIYCWKASSDVDRQERKNKREVERERIRRHIENARKHYPH